MQPSPATITGQTVLLRQRKAHPVADVISSATVTKLLGNGRMLVQFGPGEVEVYAGPNESWGLE